MNRVDTAGLLGRCVARITEQDPPPRLVIVSGDLVDLATPEEYSHLRRLLAPLAMATYVIPGNHDDREHLRAAFAEQPYMPRAGFIQYVVDEGPLRLVLMDTHVPGQDGGEVCAARLAWLADRLAEAPDRPTVIVMHHPPFLTGVANLDDMGLLGADDLARLLAQLSARRAHLVRASAPFDPGAMARRPRLGLPQHGASGGARPAAR